LDDGVEKDRDLWTRYQVNRKEFQALSRIRLREARALAKVGLGDGAYYLAGYSVECALKACIAKATRRHDFPDKKKVDESHTHNLKDLLRLAGLDKSWKERVDRDLVFGHNWEHVLSWSERSRYQTTDLVTARKFIDAVADRSHGVLSWITPHW
jgi:HEPN domain-containing protein